MALEAGSSVCNTKYSLKTRAISLEPKIDTTFSSMSGIDEEFSRPRILLTIDHHFLQSISGLLKSYWLLNGMIFLANCMRDVTMLG